MKALAVRLLSAGLPDLLIVRAIYRFFYAVSVLVFETAQWLKKVFWVEPMFRAVCSSVGRRLRIERMPYITGRGKIDIGDNVYISGKIGIAFNSRLELDPVLSLGRNSFVGHDCAFHIADEMRIGDNCLIAGHVRFYDSDGHPLDADKRRHSQPVAHEDVKKITIGNDAWIGYGAIILKGVTIGDRAIVGAGAIVVDDVPPDTIVAGNPAKPLKTLHREAAGSK